MTYETIIAKPIAGALGAEIAGVDLRRLLSNRQRYGNPRRVPRALRDLLSATRSSTATICCATRATAEPAYYPFAEGMLDFPQIVVLRKEPDQLKNVGGRWHSDTTYLDTPPIGTMLYAREIPAYGGDTIVANQYLAYEALSRGLRRMLDGVIGFYSAGADRTGREENK